MKQKVLKALAFVLTLAMALSLAACSSSGGNSSGGNAGGNTAAVENPNLDDGVNRVGICWSSFAAEATQILMENYEKHYAEYGIDEIIMLEAEGNLERQIDQLQDLANQGCDIIICNSVDPDGIAPVVENIQAQGIPVIAVDRRISTDVYYCLLYTSPSPRDLSTSRMPSSA